jgi:hypothetical protein
VNDQTTIGAAGWRALYAAAQADAKALMQALDLVMIGGNHLATHIDFDGPNWHATPDEGLAHYGAGPAYDSWCCWRAIMKAREMVQNVQA